MDTDYVRERFGEPSAWKQETEQAVRWFYPQLGVEILIDADGPEIFNYWQLDEFIIPEDAQWTKTDAAP